MCHIATNETWKTIKLSKPGYSISEVIQSLHNPSKALHFRYYKKGLPPLTSSAHIYTYKFFSSLNYIRLDTAAVVFSENRTLISPNLHCKLHK